MWCFFYSISQKCSAVSVNTLRSRQNGCQFADDIFKCIFSNANVRITIQISLKYVPKAPIDNKPALVQIKAWHLIRDKAMIWTNDDLVRWRIFLSLSLQWVKVQFREIEGINYEESYLHWTFRPSSLNWHYFYHIYIAFCWICFRKRGKLPSRDTLFGNGSDGSHVCLSFIGKNL